MSARILDCSMAEYFADPCARPSLNVSIAKTLLERSAAHAWLEHPRFGNQRKVASKAQDEGTLIHSLLLGAGTEVQIIDALDFRTKAAQLARDTAIDQRMLPVLAHKYAAAQAGVMRLKHNLADFGIELTGTSELAIEWAEESADGEVLCRCRLDHLYQDRNLIVDVKKSECASLSAATRAVMNYRYAIQNVAYERALSALTGKSTDFLFVFVECEAPYAVLPARLGGAFKQIGEVQWRAAVNLWARCLAADDWPSYTREPVVLQPPEWHLAQEIGSVDL